MALLCTPCKTGKESVYSGMKQKNIFCESGNKTGGFVFRAPLLFVPASQNRTYWEQLRAGSAAQGEIHFVRLTARLTEVVP